jgi:hypothetical protein
VVFVKGSLKSSVTVSTGHGINVDCVPGSVRSTGLASNGPGELDFRNNSSHKSWWLLKFMMAILLELREDAKQSPSTMAFFVGVM